MVRADGAGTKTPIQKSRLLLCKLHKTPNCKPPKWTAYQTARPRATQAAACLAVRSAT